MTKFSGITPNSAPLVSDYVIGVTAGNVDDRITIANLILLIAANMPTGTPVGMASFITGALATGTTIMPFDDTIPQNTEGDQYMSLTYTPKSSTNRLLITVNANFSHSVTNNQPGVALFQDSNVNALAVTEQYNNVATAVMQNMLQYDMPTGSTAATTFKVRIGSQNAGTTTFNGQSGGRRYGGVYSSSINIIEYKG